MRIPGWVTTGERMVRREVRGLGPMWLGAAAALLPGLGGCYSWQPVEMEVLAPSDQLRVELTRPAAAALPAGTFPLGGTRLRGDVVPGNTSILVLRVPVGEAREGIVTRTLRQEVEVAPSDMVQLHRRTFEPVRTGLSVVGAVGMAFLLLQAFGDVENEPGPEPPVPPGEGFRIPILSFPFP
jgi:hypothetical protein